MQFDEYQAKAQATDTTIERPSQKHLLPLLGLAGEAATLLSAYKKHLRDGPVYSLYKEEVAEELGDTLWYLSTMASHYGLRLSEIASENLEKTANRFTQQVTIKNLDADYPDGERFPRKMEFKFVEINGSVNVLVVNNGEPFGNPIRNNAYDDDGYRFHDALHLAFVAVLGWSPTVRGLLHLKRRSREAINEVEDGGRAIVIDEGIAAYVFEYARAHNMLDGARAIDYGVLRTIRTLTARLEVSVRTAYDWEQAILAGLSAFRQLRDARGGFLSLDLDARTIVFRASAP